MAAVGGAALLVSLLVLDWYGVDEGKLAPLRIEAPNPGLHAQLEPELPPLPPNPEPLPPEQALPEAEVSGDFGAWRAAGPLGILANGLILVAAIAGLAAGGLALARADPPRRTGQVVLALGALAVLLVLLRMWFPPEEIDGYAFEATVAAGAFVALAGAVLVAAGGLMTLIGEKRIER